MHDHPPGKRWGTQRRQNTFLIEFPNLFLISLRPTDRFRPKRMVSRRRDRSVRSQIALSSHWKDSKVFLVENKFTAIMKTLENANNVGRGRIGLLPVGASDGLVCLGAK
jgi:hypothetical protein